MYQARGPGRHCVAKWYSSAVSLFQVGQLAWILTTPLMNISLNSKKRMGNAPISLDMANVDAGAGVAVSDDDNAAFAVLVLSCFERDWRDLTFRCNHGA